MKLLEMNPLTEINTPLCIVFSSYH